MVELAAKTVEPVLSTRLPRHRVAGLDSIRFVCAALVMLGHDGLLPGRLYGTGKTGISLVLVGLYNALFNSPAAVIVFFVVSGFCIHFPFTGNRVLSAMPFYVRRFIRIIPPALGSYLLLRSFKHYDVPLGDSLLWSIVCEMIYYFLYPALLYLRRRSSWTVVLAVSYLAAILVVVTHLDLLRTGSNSYIALGWLTWVVGLPCWLLGCLLAETCHSFRIPSPTAIWTARLGIFGLSVLLQLVRFHVHSILASNCILLDLFAIPSFFWLAWEIAYASKHPPLRILEHAGRWSYSLYLVSPYTDVILASVGLAALDRQPRTHFLIFGVSLALSYLYFLAVEWPSYRIALAASRRVAAVS